MSSKVSFQGNQRIISVDTGVTELNARVDLYSEWKKWSVQSNNLKFLPAFRYAGGDLIIDNTISTETYTLLNGWKISIGQNCVVDGIIKSEDHTETFIPNTGAAIVVTNRVSSSGTGSSGYSGPSTVQIAQAVRSELSTELSRIDAPISSIQSGSGGALTVPQSTMLLEMYELLGLNPHKPLIVTQTSRSAGDIMQSIASSASDTIVSRM